MTRVRLELTAFVVAVCARSAAAGDPVETGRLAKDRVGRVFARPEFDPLAKADQIPEIPQQAKTWFRAFADTIVELVSDVIEAIGGVLVAILRWMAGGLKKLFGGGGSGGGGSGVPDWVGWVCAALAAGLLLFLLVRLLLSMQRERQARTAAASIVTMSAVGADDALAKSPEDWRRAARDLAAGGARRDSLRALYLALLASLHKVGAIRYDRTRTNTAYVHDLDRQHPARAPFASITHRFDAAWYGGREPGADAIDAATAEADLVLRAFREEAAVA